MRQSSRDDRAMKGEGEIGFIVLCGLIITFVVWVLLVVFT